MWYLVDMAQYLVDEITLLKKKLARKQKKLAKYERVANAKAHVKQKLKEQAFLDSCSKPLSSQYEFRVNRKCSVKSDIHEKLDNNDEDLKNCQFRKQHIENRDFTTNICVDAKYGHSKAAVEPCKIANSQHSDNVYKTSNFKDSMLRDNNHLKKISFGQKLPNLQGTEVHLDQPILAEVSHGDRKLRVDEVFSSSTSTGNLIPNQLNTVLHNASHVVSNECLQSVEKKIRVDQNNSNSPLLKTAKHVSLHEDSKAKIATIFTVSEDFHQTEKQNDSTTTSDTSFSRYTLDSDSDGQVMLQHLNVLEIEKFTDTETKSIVEKFNNSQSPVELLAAKCMARCGCSDRHSVKSIDQGRSLQMGTLEVVSCRQIKTISSENSSEVERGDTIVKLPNHKAENLDNSSATNIAQLSRVVTTPQNTASKIKLLTLKRKRKNSAINENSPSANRNITHSNSDTVFISAESSIDIIEQKETVQIIQGTSCGSKSDVNKLLVRSEELSTCDSEHLFTDHDFEILKFHYCQELKENADDVRGRCGTLGRGKGRGKRQSCGPVRQSPRLASSSSEELGSSQCQRIHIRTCFPRRGRSCHSSILLSSMFQFLVDETKRDKEEREFSLPLNQFQHLLDVPKDDLIDHITSQSEQIDNYISSKNDTNNKISEQCDMQSSQKVETINICSDSCTDTFAESEASEKAGSQAENVDEQSNKIILKSVGQVHSSIIDSHGLSRRWRYTQTLVVSPGRQLEGLVASTSKVNGKEVDIVVSFGGSTVYVWVSTWKNLGIWTSQSEMIVSSVHLPSMDRHIAVVVIAHAHGQITVQLLIYTEPENIQVQEVAVMKSKRAICCTMDTKDFVLGFYNRIDKSSTLTKYMIDDKNQQLTEMTFDRIDQELTSLRSTVEKASILGLTVVSFLHIWNSESGLLLTSINLSSVLCQNHFVVTGFYEQGLLFLPVFSGSSSSSAGGLLAVNPQSAAVRMLYCYSTDTTWKGCQTADIADDILVVQDKTGGLHFYDLYSGEYGGSYDHQWQVLAICRTRLYLGCEGGFIHAFTLMQ